jgi:DNA adenine methylase
MRNQSFLKWVGGKNQLLADFQLLYPEFIKNGQCENYYEPFLGGGSVFFDLASKGLIKRAYLSDINPDLILAYKIVQKSVQEVIKGIKEKEKEYNFLASNEQKDFYYFLRTEFNHRESLSTIDRVIIFLVLNKTCFNGMYRENNRLEFNSPWGHYKKINFEEEKFIKASKLLEIAEIEIKEYKDIKVKRNSFVYFDPPYLPISKTSSFAKYCGKGFGEEDHKELVEFCKELGKENSLMISNSTSAEKLFEGFYIEKVKALRSINSNGSKRGKIEEVIIRNYK